MNVFGDRDRIRRDERQRRIVFPYSRAHEFTVLIGEGDSRSKQVGSLRPAAQIGGVAAGAVGFIQRFAADQNVLRRELARELGEPASPAAALSTARSGLSSATLTGVAPASARRGRLLSRWLGLRGLRRRALGEHEGRAAADRQSNRRDQPYMSSHGVRNSPHGSAGVAGLPTVSG